MQRPVWLRLRPTRILREQAVHHVEHNLLRDNWVGVNLREALRTESGALRETTPIVDVGDCHIKQTAGYAVGFTAAHYGNVNDLCDLRGKDAREMTRVACIFGVGEHFPSVSLVLEIAPHQFAHQRRGEDGFGIISVARRDRFQLITIGPAVTGLLNPTKGTVPDDDAAA